MRPPANAPWVLVTGAAGFIAHHLIYRLLKEGTPVLGIDNLDAFYSVEMKRKNIMDLMEASKKTGTPFELLQDDVTRMSIDWFRNRDIRSVIHLAAKAGVRPSLKEPAAYLQANVMGTLKVLEFCRARSIQEVIFGSSSSVYGNDSEPPFQEEARCARPISPYAASKRSAELYCHTYSHLYGLKIGALRFFTVYGPRQRPDLAIHKFAECIMRGSAITLFGDGSSERDYTFVTDIVEGVIAALGWARSSRAGSYDVFNLGGGAVTTLKSLVGLLEQSLGQNAKLQYTDKQPGDVERTLADISKSRTVLGYQPRVRIEEGIPRFVDWFRNARQLGWSSRAA